MAEMIRTYMTAGAFLQLPETKSKSFHLVLSVAIEKPSLTPMNSMASMSTGWLILRLNILRFGCSKRISLSD